jgi:hypothetical protein
MKRSIVMRAPAAVLAIAVLLFGLATASAPALAQQTPDDLVSDRPNAVGAIWNMTRSSLAWAVDVTGSAIKVVLPPSPGSLAASAKDGDSSELFRLLGLAGYKLKEIDNDVGLIPGISFKFGLVRELTEADLDYLDEQLELFQARNPGFVADLQRAIVRTVATINSAGGMMVSELKLGVLPLPSASFSVTPSETVLNEEASMLMRAIQRVDRRVRSLSTTEVRPAPMAAPLTR